MPLTSIGPPLFHATPRAADIAGLRLVLGLDVFNAIQRCARFKAIPVAARFIWSELTTDVWLEAEILLSDELCARLFAEDFSQVSTDVLSVIANTGEEAIKKSQLRQWEVHYGLTNKTRCINLTRDGDSSVGTVCFRLNAAFVNWINGSRADEPEIGTIHSDGF